jgi:quinol monooxygenase YgiN
MADPTGTVVVVAVVHPEPGRLDEVLDVIAGNVPTVHAEEGCLTYAVHTATDPERVVFIERWASPEALAAHAASPHMAATNARMAPLLAAPTEVWPATSVPLGDTARGVF